MQVLTKRTTTLRDIREELQEKNISVDPKEVEGAITVLKDNLLIREWPADMKDFTTYTITGDGLDLERHADVIEKLISD
jgi:hypothetical protein